MDSFYEAFVMWPCDLLSFGYLGIQRKDRNFSGFAKYILICVSKFNQSLMGLNWHESE